MIDPVQKPEEIVSIRRANVQDAAIIAGLWEAIVAEQIYSAINRPFTIVQEREYLQGLTRREAVFLAESHNRVIGFQTLDLWTRVIRSMDHVGQIGTFMLREGRGQGIGHQLTQHTFGFARTVGYEKIIALVRASNAGAIKFYSSFGFTPCGRLTRQTKIAGAYDDEILMELFL